MNILILGHKEHGKTTAAEIISKNFNLKFTDSSTEAAKIFIYDKLKDKYNYQSFEECFQDRRNKRKEWYDLIVDYNKDDRARLAKKILENNNMYVGMRNYEEIAECKKQNLFNIIIGIYDPRKELEPSSSFNIDLFKESDIIIYNNSGLYELENKLNTLFKIFK